MLSRLITSVVALCSSADVVGGRIPATPRQAIDDLTGLLTQGVFHAYHRGENAADAEEQV